MILFKKNYLKIISKYYTHQNQKIYLSNYNSNFLLYRLPEEVRKKVSEESNENLDNQANIYSEYIYPAIEVS